MMKDKETPILANKGQTPYIPTGYEGLQQSVQRKRQIGQALMQQGLAGPGANVRSWAQVLGSLAQTWAGKSIQKDADKEEASIAEKIKAEVAQANQGLEADIAADMDPRQIVTKWGGNQWTKDRVEPFAKAMQQGLENEQEYAAPIEMKDKDGNFITAQVNKAGGIRQAPGGFGLPPVVTNVNDVAVALQRQAPGTVLPQNLTDSVIRGPGGKPMVNQEALDAKVKVAAAGAPNSQVTVNTGKELGGKMADRLAATFTQAEGAIASLGAADRIEAALNTGKARTGPWTGWRNYVEKAFGVNEEGVAQRRAVEQGIAQLGIDARKVLEGQGAVSNSESSAVEKAYSGNIDEMTEKEIRVVIDVVRRGNRAKIETHNRQLEAAARVEGAEEFIPSFELPPAYRRRTDVAPKRTGPAPARKGLPPKGATKPAPSGKATKPLVDKYSKYLPKTGG